MTKLLFALIASLFTLAPVVAQDKQTITVSGTGSVSATPDVAYIRVGVVTEDTKVSKATTANKLSMTKVFGILKEKGVEDKDVCTTNYRLDPKYTYPQNGGEPKFVGYTVSNDVLVTVRKLDAVGDLLDALTVDGAANRVLGVSFDVLDKSTLLDKARENAVADALRKANLLTKAAGTALGPVVTITEHEDRNTSAYVLGNTRDASESAAVPIAKGERQYRAHVTLVISLKNGAPKLGLGAGGIERVDPNK